MLGKLFQRLFKRKPDAVAVFIEPDMDEWACQQRQEYIDAAVESGLNHEQAANRADTWTIRIVEVSGGAGTPRETKYMPLPAWDWDWMWRPNFDTREQAEAHVADLKSKCEH